jgi:hypothetical protein
MNNRGVSLKTSDLSKNIIFSMADDQQFARIGDEWFKMKGILNDMGITTDRFVRYIIQGDFGEGKLIIERDGGILRWLEENAESVGLKQDPVAFASRLSEAAEKLQAIKQARCPKDGSPNRAISRVLSFSPGSHTHLVLLLAARSLPDSEFQRLSSKVEELLFMMLVCRKPHSGVEKMFVRWAHVFRTQGLEVLIGEVEAEKAAIRDEFVRKALSLDYTKQSVKLKYLLAKVNDHIHEVRGSNIGWEWGETTVEHIYPRKAGDDVVAESGKVDEVLLNTIGNLTILMGSDNSKLQNSPLSAKRPFYADSVFYITKIISGNLNTTESGNSRIERCAALLKRHGLGPLNEINEAVIRNRGRAIVSLFCESAGVPID